MATTPRSEVVPNYGKGLITYITADMGTAEIKSDNIPQAIEELVQLPLGEKLYFRPTWREVQPRPGRLDFPDYWKLTFDLAKRFNKRVGFRIQMRAPDYAEEALPDFVLEKVPMVKLKGEWKRTRRAAQKPAYYEPRYDHPYFQDCYRELNQLLAAELDGNPQVEFMDTFMYGFWGEGHTWPFHNNPFPDYATAEQTWIQMFEVQLEHWTRTPLVTNTQPDFSRVGNCDLSIGPYGPGTGSAPIRSSSRTSRSRPSATGRPGSAPLWKWACRMGHPGPSISRKGLPTPTT